MKKNLSLFLVVYLLQCCALAQAQIKPQQLLGTWKSQGRLLAFTSTEEVLLGHGGMYCPGTWSLDWSIEGQKLKIVLLAAGCGNKSLEFEIKELQEGNLRLNLLLNRPEATGERSYDMEWSYQRQAKSDFKASKEEVLGFWTSRRDPQRAVLLMLQDSVFFSELRAYFPWKLSQDGQWLFIQVADEPMISASAITPGIFVLRIEQQNGKVQLLMPNGQQDEPLTNLDPVAKRKEGLEKDILGKWENKNHGISYEFKSNGELRFCLLEKPDDCKTGRWSLSPGGNYLLLGSKVRGFKLEKNKLDIDDLEFVRIESD